MRRKVYTSIGVKYFRQEWNVPADFIRLRKTALSAKTNEQENKIRK
jgi:hypothetical protein